MLKLASTADRGKSDGISEVAEVFAREFPVWHMVLRGMVVLILNAMRHALVSRKDLDEALRQQGGGVSLDEVECAVLERDGKLSIVKRRS